MAMAILQSNHRDLWKEAKKFKGRGNSVTASIDGLSDGNDIAELLSKITVKFIIVCLWPHKIYQIVGEIDEIDARLVEENYIYEFE